MASLIRRTYKATLPDGTTEKRTCEHWTIQYRDAAGRIKRVKGFKDKAATRQLAAKLELAHARDEVGLVNPFKASIVRPIDEHVTEYLADLRASGCNAMYVYNAEKRLDIVFEGAGWKSLRDVEINSFVAWRNRAKAQPRRSTLTLVGKKTKTASATTLNQYLDTVRAFANWCAKMNRMPGVPISGGRVIATALAGVGKVDGPKVRVRRALTDDEVGRMLAAADESRKLPYRVAMSIGLRRGELEALQWGDLKLIATAPRANLRAEATKAGRADRVALPQSLATDLRALRPVDATDADPVFPRVPTLYWWKKDLAAAGIPYQDDQGRQVDFHGGTRKTLCTRMHRAGVPLAIAMKTMRHTDARLTMVDYADDEQLQGEAATAVLPELVGKPPSVAKAG